MKDLAEKLADISKVEVPPRMAGRRMSMILSPDRTKIEQLKRREAVSGRRQPETETAAGAGEEAAAVGTGEGAHAEATARG
jgi:hypothetical protein